jgi:hypothetical protein
MLPPQQAPQQPMPAAFQPPPQLQQNAAGAFGAPPHQGFGVPPTNAPASFAAPAAMTGPYQAQPGPAPISPHANAESDEDRKQRRAVVIAGVFALVGVAALLIVLLTGR